MWHRTGTEELERWEYGYELLGHERDFRRAFHLHDRESFVPRRRPRGPIGAGDSMRRYGCDPRLIDGAHAKSERAATPSRRYRGRHVEAHAWLRQPLRGG